MLGLPGGDRLNRGLIWAGLYLAAGVVMPVYNKALLGPKGAPDTKHYYPFPLTTSAAHALVATLALAVVTALLRSGPASVRRAATDSWILDANWRFKLKLVAVPGVLFAFNMALSNIGLHSAPANVHIVLRATEACWVVLFAHYWVQGERARPEVVATVVAVAFGSGLVALSAMQQHSKHSHPLTVSSLLVNLASAVAAAAQFVVLRRAWTLLLQRDATTHSAEVLCIKLAVSTLLLLPVALIAESGALATLFAASTSGAVRWLFFGGMALTLVYQLAVVTMTRHNRAVTSGVVAQIKTPLQIFLSIALLGEAFARAGQIVGTLIVIAATFVYARVRAREHGKPDDAVDPIADPAARQTLLDR